MQNDKLLPCPFCGGKPFVYTTGSVSCGFYVEIICENCGCRTDRAYEEVASEVWNTRKPMERIVEQLEEELKLADKEKERCAKENPLQFDSAKGYTTGINNALDSVKGGVDNGRLIDADAFEKFIEEKYKDGESTDDIKDQMLFDLSYQPTAYDVEKVERQIKNRFENYLDEIIDNPESLDKIDFLLKQNKEICNIVRNGGKE